MISLLLDNQWWLRLQQPNVLTGLILLVIGIIFAIFAKPITKLFRHRKKIESNDKILLTLKAFALVVILVSLIVMVIK